MGTGNCEVTISEAKSVSAKFTPALKPQFKLTVSDAGPGLGTVTRLPERDRLRSGLRSRIPKKAPQRCAGSRARRRLGIQRLERRLHRYRCLRSDDEPGQVGHSAEFAPAPKPKSKLTVHRTGSGIVTSSPSGIACGAACEAEYEKGTSVTLSATPGTGSEFKGWSGACTGTGACEVTMSEAKSVSAEFAPAPKLKLTVSEAGGGSGTVTSSPGGIDCDPACEAEYRRAPSSR